MDERRIYVSSPSFYGREHEYVSEVLASGWITQGAVTRKFEGEFANFCGTHDAIACSSGTAALHLMLKALGVGPGDSVIVPALTYVATANAVEYCGARPVFADVDEFTWCLDPRSVKKALLETKGSGYRPRAIIAVHLYGVLAPMRELQALADEFGVALLEDAAQAHGALEGRRRAGSLGLMASFSFYGNKILTTGEGGMVTTNDAELAERLRLYRAQGQTTRFNHTVVGFNYRMTDLAAAIGCGQLEMYPEFALRRLLLQDRYQERLREHCVFQTIPVTQIPADWLTAVLVPGDRDAVVARLEQRNIETRPFFIPLPLLEPYQHHHCPRHAAEIAAQGINLPLHVGLSLEDVDRVCDALLEAIRG